MGARDGVRISRVVARSFLVAAAVFLGLAATVPEASAAVRYDVSYFWSRSHDGVQAYRDRVAAVLGPEVARGLKVVARGDLFGLVYERGGGRSGAVVVAEVHSRLLQSRGLEAAVAVPARDWEALDDGWAEEASILPSDDSRRSGDLQSSVEDYIGRLRREGRIKEDERTAWSVYDFTSGEKLVSINEDEPFEAASMVKLFIAAAFFHKVEQGDLVYGKKSRRHMRLAIQRSSNGSTNWLLRKIGGPESAQRHIEAELPRHLPGHAHRRIHSPRRADVPERGVPARLQPFPARGLERRHPRRAGDQAPDGASERGQDPHGHRGHTGGHKGIQQDRQHGPRLRRRGDPDRQGGGRQAIPVYGDRHHREGERARNYTAWIRSRGDVIRNVSGIIYRGIAERHDL
jgi:beta-lactamase class A